MLINLIVFNYYTNTLQSACSCTNSNTSFYNSSHANKLEHKDKHWYTYLAVASPLQLTTSTVWLDPSGPSNSNPTRRDLSLVWDHPLASFSDLHVLENKTTCPIAKLVNGLFHKLSIHMYMHLPILYWITNRPDQVKLRPNQHKFYQFQKSACDLVGGKKEEETAHLVIFTNFRSINEEYIVRLGQLKQHNFFNICIIY